MHDATPAPPHHLVVLGHPEPGSFNHQVAETYVEAVRSLGQTAEIRDLYALEFDPALRFDAPEPIEEVARLEACDVLVLVYPVWFGSPPAIVKGYVDRVLGAGFRPEKLKQGSAGSPLCDKRFLTLSSSASTLPWLNARGQWESLRQGFDRYLSALFGFRGAEHVHFDAVVEATSPDYIHELLGRVEESADWLCSEIASERHRRAAREAVARRDGAAGR